MNSNQLIPHGNYMDLLLDAVCVVDSEGHFSFISAAGERIFGYKPEEMLGRNPIEFVHPDDREKTLQAMSEILGGELKPYFENRYVRKDGTVAHIMWSARWSEADRIRVAVARDVTERKRAESMQAALYAVSEAANTAEDLLALFQRIHEVVAGLLPARNFFVTLYDAEKNELSFPYYVDQYQRAPDPQPLESGILSAEVIRSGQPLLLASDDARIMPAQLEGSAGRGIRAWLGIPLESANGVMGALVAQSYSDDVRYTEREQELLQFVSTQVASAIERKRVYDRLQYMALHDHLTDLPNRALFQDRLKTALARARRDNTRLALLYLDMVRFKEVNDTYGHTLGDCLLREVALRLKQCVREVDTPGRIGGDEFIVLLDGIAARTDAALVADKIFAVLSMPYELAGEILQVVPSIGIAVYPEDGEDDMQLIRHADDAMYRAKRCVK